MKSITENQRHTLEFLVAHTKADGTFDMGFSSGPNGSMFPSLLKRKLVEVVLTRCDCCGHVSSVGRVTDVGREAVSAK